ncbi:MULTISPECIES: peptide ABC transporter substrate-binding protein [Henriciella]|jgi:oligopeptide transport system substrate-binding protein|uniref:Peptide ABC transporter substrate-binding protein n=1 Tax=Henriciella pelagia TaxID=1977912 RepID=A0ABQ1J9Z5_9PROT|nr:peptide ABC transporter substrate-binding protein [Henriciella pelagia]GGB63686.1 peptide ABC transporter substrate-binding protein [Henriciella pelagia]
MIRSLKTSLLAASAAGLVMTLAACGGGSSSDDGAKVLRRGISAKVDTLDPHRSSAKWENIVISDMIVGLMTITPERDVIPGVAESWETSEDGLTWTFKLKETVWSDGEPVTAEDFVYAFRRIQDPAIASQYSSLLYIVKNAAQVNAGELPPEELGVRAVDDYTFEITLEEPAPYLLGLLTHYTTYPVPKHIVEQYGEAWIQPENIEVNGPYKLAYWRTGDQLVSEKNPLFYEADDVCFDRVAYFEIEDASAVERRIESGELDINNGFDGGRTVELEKKFPGWVRTAPSLITTYWTLNTSQEPFTDVRVRKALAMALDREFIVEKVLTPGYIPAYSFVPPTMSNYEVDRPEVSFVDLSREERLAQARSLLEEAGYGPGNPLNFEFIYRSTDDNPKVAPVAQANWQEIAPWVRADILKQDTKVLYARLRQSDFEAADGAWVADFDDPINFLYLLDSTTGQQNYGRYSNPEYDNLLARASQERDLDARAAIFAEAEALMLEDYPITPMWVQVTKNLVDPDITGWGENAQDDHLSRWMCRADAATVSAESEAPSDE